MSAAASEGPPALRSSAPPVGTSMRARLVLRRSSEPSRVSASAITLLAPTRGIDPVLTVGSPGPRCRETSSHDRQNWLPELGAAVLNAARPPRLSPTLMLALAIASAACGDEPPPRPPPPIIVEAADDEVLLSLAAWDAAESAVRANAARAVDAAAETFELIGLTWFELGARTHEVAVFRHVATGLEFVLVPGGEFAKTRVNWNDPHWRDEEHPRTVVVEQPFLLARSAITWGAWNRVMSDDRDDARRLAHELTSIDAEWFCHRAGFDVPRSSQWEHACRASRPLDLGHRKRQPAPGTGPGAMGLFGLCGGDWVAEWCRNDVGANGEGEGPDAGRLSRGSDESRLLRRFIGEEGCNDMDFGEPRGALARAESGFQNTHGVRPARQLRVVSETE